MRKLTLPNDVNVAIQLWDIGGQTIGGKMVGNYDFRGTSCVTGVRHFKPPELQNLEDWYAVVKKTFAGGHAIHRSGRK